MKKIIYLAALLFSGSGLFAQIHEGIIIYERKINMHRRIQDEQMKAMIPEFRTSKHQLLFSDSVSVYKIVPEDEMPEAGGEGGGRMIVRMGAPGDNGELYKNFAEGKSIQSTDLGAQTFIISDSIIKRSWKLTGETKTIMGYNCRKAVSTETMMMGGGIRISMNGSGNTQSDTTNRPKPKEVTVEAWYAEGITAPVGPDSYGMLPGVILELNVDNGAMLYTAVEVKKEVSKKEIKEPKKGKKVTREEFMKMQMELMGGNGGNRTIRF
jgi:GLPGLI family protein